MNMLVAVVALAVLAGGGSGESSPSVSVSIRPRVAIPPQITRIKLQITTHRNDFVIGHVHPDTSRCGKSIMEELDRWRPFQAGRGIAEKIVRPGTTAIDTAFHGQPGTYRVCVYLHPSIAASTTFEIRAPNRVMRIGRGIGAWTLNERFVRRTGYEFRYPETTAVPSCRRSLWEAARVDAYTDGVTVAWIRGRLASVRTMLRGDRSEDGFVIGTAHMTTVRARHPNLHLRSSYFDSIGNRRLLVASKSTATGIAELRYWFDAKGVLLALETSERRC